MLQIHNNPEQVNKFINQLISGNEADVYIHIDKRNYEKLYGKLVKNKNVFILHDSVNCEWGDISQVDATLLLIKEVLDSGRDYDFVCLRSGQDLLVKSNFKAFLLEHKKNIFLSNRKLNKNELGLVKIKWPKMTRKRYANYHPIRIYRRLLSSLYNKGINIRPNPYKLPSDYSIFKGSQWFSIPLEVAQYIVDFISENRWYYKFFENSLVPDESFFHTLILNSPYKSDVINSNLCYLKWGETVSDRNSPQYLQKEDIPSIEKSNMFFARKFDESIDAEVVDYFANHVKVEHESKLHAIQV